MKKGRAKKLLGICSFSYGSHDHFSVLPVQAAAPRMYTIQPGKTWTDMISPAMERKTGLRLSGEKVSRMGAGTVQIFM